MLKRVFILTITLLAANSAQILSAAETNIFSDTADKIVNSSVVQEINRYAPWMLGLISGAYTAYLIDGKYNLVEKSPFLAAFGSLVLTADVFLRDQHITLTSDDIIVREPSHYPWLLKFLRYFAIGASLRTFKTGLNLGFEHMNQEDERHRIEAAVKKEIQCRALLSKCDAQ